STEAGDAASSGVTAKVAVPESSAASVPVNRFGPAGASGSWKAQTKVPNALVRLVQALPSLQSTVTLASPAYPVPLKASEEPTGPRAGVLESWGVTMNA